MTLDAYLSSYPAQFERARVSDISLEEAKKRVLDTLACFYGAFGEFPAKTMRAVLAATVSGESTLWGTSLRVPADLAVWHNGTGVRTLDYNDTYLSKEPCHPSDLLAPLWAACELSSSTQQGALLLRSLVLSYEVLCRLCDAGSLRKRGWDHVSYLPVASAVGCSLILRLSPRETRHAIALSLVAQNALRQTRVGEISDWKAACAAYSAKAGLWAARLARAGFTGPSGIFSGRNGFERQVSGSLRFSRSPLREPWKILSTHTKYFPAEYHSQSAIEAALRLRLRIKRGAIEKVVIDSFGAAVEIIGSEPEKWAPRTRETADHSLPYLVAVALLDGDLCLAQYQNKRFLEKDVRSLLKNVRVRNSAAYSRLYPRQLPAKVTVFLRGGTRESEVVFLPKGYAGNPMTIEQVTEKFFRLAEPLLNERRCGELAGQIARLEQLPSLSALHEAMEIKR